jgi:type IV pilus assembly protein PilE
VIFMKRRLLTGFTLIELMVTVAIIAIIAAVALPSYQSQVRKSRRADAVAAVSVIQQAEERWRANKASYTSILGTGTGGLGFTVNGVGQYVSAGGYYTLSVSFPLPSTPASHYMITATAVSGTSQASDTGCTSLYVDVSGGNATNTPTACWSK